MTDLGVRIRLERALRHAQRQHAELAELEQELQRAVDRSDGEVGLWLSRYASGLMAHFNLEEDVLFPIIFQMGGELSSGIRELVKQHGSLRDELVKLEGTSNAYSIAAGLAALRVQVTAHERLEESLATEALALEEASDHGGSTPPRRSPL